MIAGIFHQGSGLGNQLHRYVATRCLALDKGVDFGMVAPELFKGSSFMNLDMGKPVLGEFNTWQEQKLTGEKGLDIRIYDERIQDVPDNTIIDGEFQDPKYFMHHFESVREWLAVEPMSTPYNECIIGFRGGEYQYFPELFLTPKYWNDAIAHMVRLNPKMRFRVVTDDPALAQVFFPEYEITHDVGNDWRNVRYAKYLIIANSSFYIFPALLNENVKFTIAPLHWARHNIEVWALPQNKYPGWHYMDRRGNLTQLDALDTLTI